MSLYLKGISAILTIVLIFSVSTVFSQHAEHGSNEKKSFDSSVTIMEHIADAYDWHIATIDETHISIPLPVILISNAGCLEVFMSSNFNHGHDSYKGFHIAQGKDNPYKGKIVEEINGQEVRPYDFSITKNTLSLFITLAIILWVFISVAKTYKVREGKAPKGLQSFLEPLIIFIRDDIAKSSIGEKKYMKFMPFLLSVFFFIFLNNLLGLIPIFPGGANLTGNIAITMVLAAITFIITTVNANKHYWVHIFNAPGVPWWLKLPIPLMPFVELLGIFTKPFVLMVRLFANITAGHIVALGFFSLIFIFGEISVSAGLGVSVFSVAFTIFLTMLELLVAFIQAYVFTLLSALYFGTATEENH